MRHSAPPDSVAPNIIENRVTFTQVNQLTHRCPPVYFVMRYNSDSDDDKDGTLRRPRQHSGCTSGNSSFARSRSHAKAWSIFPFGQRRRPLKHIEMNASET